jgi:hypothetical protein
MHTDPDNIAGCQTTVFMDPGLAALPPPGMTALASYRVVLWSR